MQNFPKHIAVIMDGNGRWAEKRLLPRIAGHNAGVDAAKDLIKHCIDKKINVLTLFAFSSENWNRPKSEVNLLMSLLKKLLKNEIENLHSQIVKLRVVGEIEALNNSLQKAIYEAENLTKNNTGLQLNIAVNYGGRWDIIQAVKKVATLIQDNLIKIDKITEGLFKQHLVLNDLPEPDLLIRTSGEQRLSNFLLWQCAYTEIFFTNTLWPDFKEQDLAEALLFYANRQRRFGSVTKHAHA